MYRGEGEAAGRAVGYGAWNIRDLWEAAFGGN